MNLEFRVAQIGRDKVGLFLGVDKDDGFGISDLPELLDERVALRVARHFDKVLLHIRIRPSDNASSDEDVSLHHVLGSTFLDFLRERG